MTTKVTEPLFASTASGRVHGIGIFQKKRGAHYVTLNIIGNSTPVPATAHLRQGWQAAHNAWMHTPTIKVHSGGRIVRIHNPRWPDYWRAFLAQQPTHPFRTANLSP